MRNRGVALVIVLLAIAVMSALGLGLLLTTSVERLTTANHRDGVEALFAAEAAIEIAIGELALIPDWDAVLRGATRSRFVLVGPAGLQSVPGGAEINLTNLTNQLTCGRTTGCTMGQTRTSTLERPWGANNPQWQLFVVGPLGALLGLAEDIPDAFVVVWLGDDAREQDGDPLTDGGGGGAGQGAMRARAAAFGRNATRRLIEADLIRRDRGIHVQSWRVVTSALP